MIVVREKKQVHPDVRRIDAHSLHCQRMHYHNRSTCREFNVSASSIVLHASIFLCTHQMPQYYLHL